MTLTEIIFEVADERYPLCRLTDAPSDAVGIMRVIDSGRASGRFRTLLTYYGTEAEAVSVARELRASRVSGDLEVLSMANGVVTIQTDAPIADAEGSVRILGVLRLLESFGTDSIIEPFVFRRGRVRARVIVPRRMDTQHALAALQEIQRSSGFSDFKVVRVAAIAAPRYVDVLRRILAPDQESLLRLAASMGYYETPKGATLEKIADKVGLSVSPVHKRLKTIEETLVGAHVEPSRVATTGRRRKRAAESLAPTAWPCEFAVRVYMNNSHIAAFTQANPGSSALLQILEVNPATSTTTFLLVVLADEKVYPSLLADFEARPDVIRVEIVEKDRAHATVKVHMRMATQAGTTFPWWHEVWGQDGIIRPFVFENGSMILRFLVVRPISETEIRLRLDKTSKLGRWDGYEILAARSTEDARLPAKPPEPPTARQEEVLKIAHALGYYRTPRACTLEHVAKTLGVSANAIHKNLSSAENKVIADYLAAGL